MAVEAGMKMLTCRFHRSFEHGISGRKVVLHCANRHTSRRGDLPYGHTLETLVDD